MRKQHHNTNDTYQSAIRTWKAIDSKHKHITTISRIDPTILPVQAGNKLYSKQLDTTYERLYISHKDQFWSPTPEQDRDVSLMNRALQLYADKSTLRRIKK